MGEVGPVVIDVPFQQWKQREGKNDAARDKGRMNKVSSKMRSEKEQKEDTGIEDGDRVLRKNSETNRSAEPYPIGRLFLHNSSVCADNRHQPHQGGRGIGRHEHAHLRKNEHGVCRQPGGKRWPRPNELASKDVIQQREESEAADRRKSDRKGRKAEERGTRSNQDGDGGPLAIISPVNPL